MYITFYCVSGITNMLRTRKRLQKVHLFCLCQGWCTVQYCQGATHACHTRGKESNTRVHARFDPVIMYVSMYALAAGVSRHAHSTASLALVLLAYLLLSWYLYTSLQARRKLPLRPNNLKTRGRACVCTAYVQ